MMRIKNADKQQITAFQIYDSNCFVEGLGDKSTQG
jgi:hypothetical protein